MCRRGNFPWKKCGKSRKRRAWRWSAFIHGAMCYCYSGQCLFSSILGGRSGNRGRCAQPCRLPYEIYDGKRRLSGSGYPLSLKDMCTLEYLPALLEAGIDSFKIEGRMKRPEYAAGVTAVYRKYIDLYYREGAAGYRVAPEDMDRLRRLYIRSEIQTGYYERHNGKEMVTMDKPGYESCDETLLARLRERYIGEPEKMPVLGDLYELLRQQPEAEAQRIATALEIYVTGSLNVFNHRTNVKINSRIVCYVIKKLGKQLKKFGMQVVQDQVWGRVSENREAHKSTRLYIDEMHLLLREEQTAAYTVEIWKRFRKWGGIPTGLTQNVKDLLSSREIENILENSDFIYMLNQAGGDRQILAKQLNISPHQLGYVTNSNAGEGLLFFGSVIIPFVDHFPKDTELYEIMTTRLEDLAAQ